MVAVVAIAGVAFAAAPFVQSVIQTQWMQNGAYFIPYTQKAETIGTAGTYNKVADMRSGYAPYQFGTITAPLWNVGGCVDGPTFAKTGVRVGDECDVFSDRSVWDGGKPYSFYPLCEVPASDFILLKGCVHPNDGGIVVTVVDAGYYYYTRGFTTR